MVRQGSDSRAGLAFIPSGLDRPPNKRLKLGFQIFLAFEKTILLTMRVARSAYRHAGEDRAERSDRQGLAPRSLLVCPMRVMLMAPPTHR